MTKQSFVTRGTAGTNTLHPLLFHNLFRFLIRHFGNSVLELLQERLNLFLALVAIVLGHLLRFLGLIEVFVAVAAEVDSGLIKEKLGSKLKT